MAEKQRLLRMELQALRAAEKRGEMRAELRIAKQLDQLFTAPEWPTHMKPQQRVEFYAACLRSKVAYARRMAR